MILPANRTLPTIIDHSALAQPGATALLNRGARVELAVETVGKDWTLIVIDGDDGRSNASKKHKGFDHESAL
jgi:hypothetical protein